MNSKQPVTRKVSTFRHFCRGGYAIFSSLHREVRIGVLSVGMLVSVNIPKAQALQVSTHPDCEDEGDEKELSEVAITGTMAPLTALQSARIVSVITAQQIESSSAQSVNDLLKLAVGVDVRQRGGFGIQTDISIDGGTFDQITILLNGVNISSPQTGHLAADFPVNLSDIERIEVLEGAASRVYGASAFGGAINIVTKNSTAYNPTSEKETNISSEAGVQGGAYATYGGDARITLCHELPSSMGGTGGGSLSFAYLQSDGATSNSDFQHANTYLSGHLDVDKFRVDWQGGWSYKSYGANTFYSAAYPNQFERNNHFIASIGAETKGKVQIRPNIYWHRLLDNFELIRHSTSGENFHCTDVYGVHVCADVAWAAGHTAIGGDIREESIYSTSLGHPITGILTHQVPCEELFYTCHDSRTNLSFNIEHNVILQHFTASIGVLSNYNSRFDERPQFYPGIDLAFNPAPQWRLFASYDKGFRLPTFTDLYYKSPTHEGNQGMRAEESHSFQLGTTFRSKGIDATIKGFYHHGTNMIDWVMYAPADVFHSANFNLDNRGLQVQLALHFTPLLGREDTYIQHLTVAYTNIQQQRRDEQEVYKSNYTMEYLRHKFVATLDHRLSRRLTASWSLRWQDRAGHYILYNNTQSTGHLVSYEPYAVLDVKLRWAMQHYEWWLEGTNLTNQTYYDLGNIPQPGLVLLTGVRLRF